MKAEITGENQDSIGLHIIDNKGPKHKIEMKKDGGDIYHHYQDSYADNPDDRTLEENEHVAQAQRFAKYYVYRQRGYDTLPPLPNPDRISAVAAFIDAISEDTFEAYFGDLYQQMLSHAGRAEPVVDVPEAAEQHPTYYRQDVYVDATHEDLHTAISESPHDPLDALQPAAESSTDATGLYSLLTTLRGEASAIDPTDEHDLVDSSLEAVSGVHVMWSPASNQTETVETDTPKIDRKPDARLELPPYEPDSLGDFQEHLVAHLTCQIRDCYLTMGVAPPQSVRVQGPGWFDRSTWFQHYDVYEPYHSDDIEITDWQEQYTPAEMLGI